MKIGVSTSCLFPMLTEDALQRLISMGIGVLEVFLNSPSEVKPEFARLLRDRADAAGAEIVAVHPCSSEYEGVSFFGRYPRRFDDAAEEYRRYFEFCNIVGADILAFHGARSLLPIRRQVYFERYQRLGEIAQSCGVRLCQENVAQFHSATPEFIRALREAVPEADFLLDLKQAVRARSCPLEMLSAMGQNVRHIHISDHNCECDCLPPGAGEFDYAGFAGALRSIGYDSAVMIELYRWNYESDEQLAKSEKFLSKILCI